jgi:peptide/nickel transport system substrate-binding protein
VQRLELRRAMALSLDRKAFIDILDQGHGDIGGVLQPPPEGLWGMPPELLKQVPGYDPDVAKNRAQARQLMQTLGYAPDKTLPIKVSTRDLPPFRNAAALLIDQLKRVNIDGELEIIGWGEIFSLFPSTRLRRGGLWKLVAAFVPTDDVTATSADP